MIAKAQKEIKEFNQQSVFQKGEIKKRTFEKSIERSLKLKNNFKENYDHFLNQSLSSTLLSGKGKISALKNQLVRELKRSLFELIEDKIEKNYSNYIEFLLETIKEIKISIDKPQEIELIFSSRDYKYLMENYGKIQNLFKNPVEINKDTDDFIGGFKISLVGGIISYDYTIDNLINTKSSFIQMEISKLIDDSEIKQIEQTYDIFIQNQKTKIKKYIEKYDQIQI